MGCRFTTQSVDEDSHWGAWARIEFALQHFCVLAICAVLLGAVWVQFGQGEFPCPLCLQQRMAMMLAAIGSIFVITHGRFARVEGFSVMGRWLWHVHSRRIARDVDVITAGAPAHPSRRRGIWLTSLWTSFVYLGFDRLHGGDCGERLHADPLVGNQKMHCPDCCKEQEKPGTDKPQIFARLGWYSWIVFGVFAAIVSVNVVATFFEAGFNPYLPDNPDSYILIEGEKPVETTPAAK